MTSKFSGLKSLISGSESRQMSPEENPATQAPENDATSSVTLEHLASQETNAAISAPQMSEQIAAPKDDGGIERDADGKKNANYYLPVALIDLIAQREYELKMNLPRASRRAFNKSVLVETILKQVLGECSQKPSNNLKRLVADKIIERKMSEQKAEPITKRDGL